MVKYNFLADLNYTNEVEQYEGSCYQAPNFKCSSVQGACVLLDSWATAMSRSLPNGLEVRQYLSFHSTAKWKKISLSAELFNSQFFLQCHQKQGLH